LPPQKDIDRYIKEDKVYRRIKNTGKDIDIKVSNDGSSVANNIYIDIKFPEELKIIEVNDIDSLKEPKKLNVPVNPIKKAEREYAKKYLPLNLGTSSLLGLTNFDMGALRPIGSMTLLNRNPSSWVDDNIITIKLNKLIHTRKIGIDEKYRIIPLEVGNFKVEVNIICEEYEENHYYVIPVSVEEV
jgi:hypothetical protein